MSSPNLARTDSDSIDHQSSSLLLPTKTYPRPTPHRSKIKVGILGCTGTVGQRFITLLTVHPWFVIDALGASGSSAGKTYEDAVRGRWMQEVAIPDGVKAVKVRECRPEQFAGCDVVFSGLDAAVAGDIESAFRTAEFPVFSNASSHRRDPNVPLLVPLVNPSHLSIIPQQQQQSSPLTKGFIVTNANCSTTAYVIPLCALENAFGPVEKCIVTTMQAVSGAGYPGVSAMDVLDNVVPYIDGEEEKMEWETLKILGGITDVSSSPSTETTPPPPQLKKFDMHAPTPLHISASCNRVPVSIGHTICLSLRFSRRPPPSPQQVRECLSAFTPVAQTLGCPSAPRRAIVVHEEVDRPQPRLDRGVQDGAGVSVGRVRQCRVLDIKFVVLANNVSIGAATSSIINAELAILKGIVVGAHADKEKDDA